MSDYLANMQQFQNNFPFPMCTIDEHGRLICYNALFEKICKSTKLEKLQKSKLSIFLDMPCEEISKTLQEEKKLLCNIEDKIFELRLYSCNDKEHVKTMFFVDVTEFEILKQKSEAEKPCIAIIHIDNYDEIYNNIVVETQNLVASKIDELVREWATSMSASLNKQSEHQYVLIFTKEHYDEQIENKFEILDKIRNIQTDAAFPATISIGIGINADTMEANSNQAIQALDLALGRGGDQVVIKDGEDLTYFGGKTQTVEKNNKGKARVISYALQRLMAISTKIVIMGHRNADMDAFGSAMGLTRMAKAFDKPVYIVLEEYGEPIEALYGEALESGEYNIISHKKALEILDRKTLLIVVDTHKQSMTECPELLDIRTRRVVIDHHRRDREFIQNLNLAYMESYASSTAELVSEMLQYAVDKKDISKLEADGLLAGMVVDTNHFSVKTGVRTFEAAAWLRRVGADIANVKRLLQVDKKLFMARARGVSSAIFDEDIVYSILPDVSSDMQMLCSIVADELLTIKDIKMSFAIGKNDKDQTVVSARSIGDINVQIIMEALGGGGHLNAAGVQTEMEPKEVIERIREVVGEL